MGKRSISSLSIAPGTLTRTNAIANETVTQTSSPLELHKVSILKCMSLRTVCFACIFVSKIVRAEQCYVFSFRDGFKVFRIYARSILTLVMKFFTGWNWTHVDLVGNSMCSKQFPVPSRSSDYSVTFSCGNGANPVPTAVFLFGDFRKQTNFDWLTLDHGIRIIAWEVPLVL
jgi:hypothetical protein